MLRGLVKLRAASAQHPMPTLGEKSPGTAGISLESFAITRTLANIEREPG